MVGIYAFLLVAAEVESVVWAEDLVGTCSISDAEGSNFDVGTARLQWLPPSVRCTWSDRPSASYVPNVGAVLVGVPLGFTLAVIVVSTWMVRRARRRAEIEANT